MKFDFNKLAREAWEVVETSITDAQREHRERIFGKLATVIEAMKVEEVDEETAMAQIAADFELFCVCHVRLDDLKPMFPAVWQSEAVKIFENHEENLFILCRKVGKTALGTAYALWKTISTPACRLIIFAPTEQQLFMMQDVIKCLNRSPYMTEEYIREKDAPHRRGRKSDERVIFGHNWSEIIPMNLAQKQIAATKRGQKGSVVIVDEIGLVLKDVQVVVIDDMMADAYSDKKMLKFGTPDKLANPELENEWRDAQNDDEIGTFTMTIWDGVEQGIIRKNYVKKRFKKLHIPCPWGQFDGICGKIWFPGQLYDENHHIYPNWECNECCTLNEAFVVENLGEFPQTAGRFFPKPYLEAMATSEWDVSIPDPKPEATYVMGIDYGMIMNPTQVTVWELLNDTLVLNHWLEIPPVEPDQRGGKRDFDPINRRIQEIYRAYGPGVKNQIKRIFPDATAVGTQVTADLTKGEQGIPSSKIYCNETAQKRETLGVYFSGPYKSQMMTNYRKLIMDGRIKVPRRDPYFSKFMMEHDNIIVTSVESENYLKFKEPRGGSVDLIDSQALAALELSDEIKGEGAYLGYVAYRPPTRAERRRKPPPDILIAKV